MKIAIVGWGVEGQSAFRYFGPEHEYLIVNEEPRDDFPPESSKIKVQFVDQPRTPGLTGNVADLSYLNGIEFCDKIIYTPTVRKNLESVFPPDDPMWKKATTNQHIFFESIKTKNIVGVTGTKGKGTTSTLIARLLEAAGFKVHLGGNIGRPLLDFVNDIQPDDWVVLELANFQLYKLPYSPHIAVCLMIVREHMEWHPDMEDYLEAKANIFKHQKSDDIAIYFPENENSSKIAQYSAGKKIPYFKPPGAYVRGDGQIVIDDAEIINKADVKLLGEHNLQNICAAVTAVWQVTKDQPAIKKVLAEFSGLEHRLEFVREFNGVSYYDDSFATTPETTIVAMQAIKQPKVMILGGHDKGADMNELADEVIKQNVRHVITIGLIGPKIAELLKSKGYNSITPGLTDMGSIVTEVQKLAKPGDAVLLSCGTSSFGLFKDYKDRGNQFKQVVQALA